MKKKRLTGAINGCNLYEKETAVGKRVFTVRAARQYDLDQLQTVIDYMLETNKLDTSGNEKDAYSFRNIMKVAKEKALPPTKEELKAAEKIYDKIQKKHLVLMSEYNEKADEKC